MRWKTAPLYLFLSFSLTHPKCHDMHREHCVGAHAGSGAYTCTALLSRKKMQAVMPWPNDTVHAPARAHPLSCFVAPPPLARRLTLMIGVVVDRGASARIKPASGVLGQLAHRLRAAKFAQLARGGWVVAVGHTRAIYS